ncbi:MAG: lytic transglycosylase domain-containing protein [Geminicoccaceae bacterium]
MPSRLSRRHAVSLSLASATTLALGRSPVLAAQPSFEQWLDGVRAEAQRRGVSPATLDQALAGLELDPSVIELDRRQPEGRISFATYRSRVLSSQRVETGKAKLRAHRTDLERVAARYGVPPRIIVALWGIETSYGGFTGGKHVIRSLASLAYDGRRAEFFHDELMHALSVLDTGVVAHPNMKGSWAGAMGQSQFMPSTYRRYAVDADGDGKADIWQSLPDIFASMANYLREAGWDGDYIWGRQVRLPAGFAPQLADLDTRLPLSRWADLGVRRADGGPLPVAPIDASVIAPDGLSGPAYIIYDNFRVLMIWNRSSYFALTVGELSDRIRWG